MPRPRAILFDLDGTLVHSMDAILDAFAHALREAGHPLVEPERVKAHVGIPLSDMFLRLVEGCDETQAQACCRVYRERYAVEAPGLTRLHPGVPGVIEALARDVPLAVVTTKATGPATEVLEGFALHRHFRTVVGFDDVARPKPAPDGVLVAAKRLGVAPGACCLVGDTPHDVGAALAAGALAVGVLTGTGTRADLEAAGAHHVIDDLHALLEVLDGGR